MLVKKLFFIGVLSLSIFGMDHSKMKHSKMEHSEMNKGSRVALSESVKISVVKVLEANETLHSSFFDYKGEEVEKNARALIVAMESVKDAEISKLLTFSKTKLSEITASNDREKNNENYHLVSMALIHIINKYDVGAKYNAYSCPMVKKKWIQNSAKLTDVSNPYAPGMENCGSQDSNY